MDQSDNSPSPGLKSPQLLGGYGPEAIEALAQVTCGGGDEDLELAVKAQHVPLELQVLMRRASKST